MFGSVLFLFHICLLMLAIVYIILKHLRNESLSKSILVHLKPALEFRETKFIYDQYKSNTNQESEETSWMSEGVNF